ncbi:MAG: hypothetical protein JJT78_13150 [Leptospira sp.]|nr:hypothetical protein [Leptospira sp.]
MKKISIMLVLLIPSILFSVTQADVKATIDDLSRSVAFTETVQDSSGNESSATMSEPESIEICWSYPHKKSSI